MQSYLLNLPLQDEESGGCRLALFDALKSNQSLTHLYLRGYDEQPVPDEEEKQYFRECLLENSKVTKIHLPWAFEELESILERNAQIVEQKRFKITKLAAQHL